MNQDNALLTSTDIGLVESGGPAFSGSKQEDSFNPVSGTLAFLGLSAISAVYGLANTVPLIANTVGGEDTMEYLSTLDFAQGVDEAFNSGSSMADFYGRHAEGIELTGAIAGSIAPGLGAVKLAKAGMSASMPLISRIAATESDHIVTKSAAWLSGQIETSTKTRILRNSYDSLLQGSGAMTKLMTLDKFKYMLSSGVQLGAEAAVFEAGSMLAQMKNPTYNDINDLGDFTKHMATAAVFGGTLGGLISYPLMKSASFLPAVDAIKPVTLRETATVLGDIRQNVINIQDFGEKLASISTGTKVAALVDDMGMNKTVMKDYFEGFKGWIPESSWDQFNKTIDGWFNLRDAKIDSLVKERILDLTGKSLDNAGSIGGDFLRATIRNEQGDVLITGDRATQLLDGATKISPLKATVGRDSVDVISTAPFSEDAASVVKNLLMNETELGKKFRTVSGERLGTTGPLKFLKEQIDAGGSKETIDKLRDLIDKRKITINDFLSSSEVAQLQKAAKDPRFLDPMFIKATGIPEDTMRGLIDLFGIENRASVTHTFDMKLGRMVDKPIAHIGDILEKPTQLNIKGGTLFAGNKALMTSFAKAVTSTEAPKTYLDAQLLWEKGGHGVRVTKSKEGLKAPDITYGSGNNAFFAAGEFNPFKLAAAIDKDIPIQKSGVTYSRQEALVELKAQKMRLYERGINSGMPEPVARLYADVPAEGELATWIPSKGRENDFMARRNVEISYKKEQLIPDMDAKTAIGMRGSIVAAQIAASEKTYAVLERIGVELPEIIKEQMNYFRQFGINGEQAIDWANRANAGVLTNASGRMLTLNTQVTAFGSYLNSALTAARNANNRTMASEVQKILRGAAKDADLDQLRVFHTKIVGGGDKWYKGNVVNAELPPNVFISRSVAQALKSESEDVVESAMSLIATNDPKYVFKIENENIANLLTRYIGRENMFREANLDIMKAKGFDTSDYIPGQLYFPPTDVRTSPYFALVSRHTNDAAGGLPEYTFVHARSSADLAEKVKLINQEFDGELRVVTKEQIDLSKALKGEYERARAFSSYSIDSALHSKGVFSEFFPRKGEEIIEEMLTHLDRGASNAIRHGARAASGDFLPTLDRLSSTLDQFAKSTHGKAFGPGKRGVTPDNSYSQLMKSFLDIGPDENSDGILGMLTKGQNIVVNYAEDVMTMARDIWTQNKYTSPEVLAKLDKRADSIVALGKQLGLDFPKMNGAILAEAEQRMGKTQTFRAFTSALNTMSAMLTLGAELINPLIQSISLPITINSAIRQLLADAPPSVKDKIMESIPTAWGASRALSLAARDFWTELPQMRNYWRRFNGEKLNDKELTALDAWLQTPSGKFHKEMADTGFIQSPMRQFMIEIGEATDLAEVTASEMRKKLITIAGYATAGNRYAEMFQRYAALKIAGSIADTAGLNQVQRFNMLHAFSTQANGVYTAAQRPGLFQGVIGSGFGLYKSYTINLMQALGRHIENRDGKALLTLGALQGSVFGVRSLPGYEQLNKYVMDQHQKDGRDAYTIADSILGRDASNALLYGLPSMFMNANLYSRGDLRPATILGDPTQGVVGNFPALQQFVQAGKAVAQAASNISNGAPIGTALNQAIAHQSLWRPAARMAEFIHGTQTTGTGIPIQELSAGFMGWNVAVRLAGARPFDEAVASDAYYRMKERQTGISDASRALTSATRQYIGANEDIPDSLYQDYTKAGGSPRQFRAWVRRIQQDMSTTQIERMKKSLRASGYAGFAQQMDIPSEE